MKFGISVPGLGNPTVRVINSTGVELSVSLLRGSHTQSAGITPGHWTLLTLDEPGVWDFFLLGRNGGQSAGSKTGAYMFKKDRQYTWEIKD
jgi:hypothetical protein